MDKRLIIPLVVIFLDILWFSFILPSIWFIIKDFWGDAFIAWLIVSLTAFWMFAWWIILWKLSDKFGRKEVLLVSIFLNILGYILFWFANNLFVFWLARFLNWFWGWGWSILQAYIWDISSEENKVKNLWLVWASSGLGFLLWPILWYFFVWKEINFIWYFSAILLIIAFLSVCIYFKNNNKTHNEIHLSDYSRSKLFYLFFISFWITFCVIGLQTIFPFYLSQIFGFWVKNIYLTFWYLWIIALIYQVWILNFVQKKLWETWLLKLGLILVIASLFCFIFANNLVFFYIILTLFVIWYVNINIWLSANVISNSNKHELWHNLGLNMWFWSIWEILWSLIWWSFLKIMNNYIFSIFLIFIVIWFVLFNLKQKKEAKM